MTRARLIICIWLIAFTSILNAKEPQKKPLTIDDIAGWKTIVKPIISDDGSRIAYELNPLKGDGNLLLKANESKETDTIKRGYEARFSSGSDFIVYKIKQPQDTIRSAKKKKLKKEQMPKDSLGVFVFLNKKKYTFPDIKQYSLPKENAMWVSFLTEMKKAKEKKAEEKEKAEGEKEEKVKANVKAKENEKDKEIKSRLTLLNPTNGDTLSFVNITDVFYAPLGSNIYFIRQSNDTLSNSELLAFDTKTKNIKVLFSKTGTIKKLTCDEKGLQFGFLFSTDTIKEKVFTLYYGNLLGGEPKAIVTPMGNGLPLGWSPSEFEELSFSQNGRYLYFGTGPAPVSEPKDSLLEEEKPQLDIWSWKDVELQPEQKIGAEKEKKRTYKAVYLTEEKRFVQLGDPVVRQVNTINKGNGKMALGLDPMAYKLEASWTGKSTADYYIVEVETGNKRLMVKDKSLVKLSPGGNYLVWYDENDSAYYARSTAENSPMIDISSMIPVDFFDEQWDVPDDPKPYGIAGWSENDKYVFLYDRYDIWRADLEGLKVPVNATRNYGRNNRIRFRYQQLDPEEEFIDTNKPVIVHGFNEGTKAEGYFKADFRSYTEPKLLLMEDYKFDRLAKAKKADMLIWTRENVSESPNIWTAGSQFEHRHVVSDPNPQQKIFVWPNVKLVHGKTF